MVPAGWLRDLTAGDVLLLTAVVGVVALAVFLGAFWFLVCPTESTEVLRCQPAGDGAFECTRSVKTSVRCDLVKDLASRHGLGEVDAWNGFLAAALSLGYGGLSTVLLAFSLLNPRLGPRASLLSVLAVLAGLLLAACWAVEDLAVWLSGRWWVAPLVFLLSAAMMYAAVERADKHSW